MQFLGASLTAVVALLASVPLASAAPASPRTVGRRQGVPVPANDPFYTPPAGYQNTQPGTVLNSRTISASFLSDIPDPVEAWQVLYRTTAINGTPIATVTTVFKPWLFAKTDRFISYQTAYDSSDTACDPSYNYRLGSMVNNIETDGEFLEIELLLLSGYIVASPDYEGPDAAFSAGPLEGMGVLDGIRAVNNFGSTIGFSTATPMVVGVGYSGGAIATGWAASLQPTYAPELNMMGWAQGGTPANLTSTMQLIDDTEWSGFLPAAVAGLTAPSAFGSLLLPTLDKYITAYGTSAITYSQTHCFTDDLLKYAFTSVLSTNFQTLGAALLYEPAVQDVFAANVMGANETETPSVPTLVYHAAQDEIIPYSGAVDLVNRWCSRDASVKFSTYEKGGHVTTLLLGIPEVFSFIGDAFEGNAFSGCSTNSYLSSDLDVIGLAVELEPILSKVIELLGRLALGENGLTT